jgi:DNA replication licensing factor MCM2
MLPHDDDADALDDDDLMRDVDDLDEEAEEAEGIDLFADDFENDYRARENDMYEGEGIDDEGDYDDLDLAQRRELDRRLNRRDQEARRRMPAAFLPDEDEQDGLADLMGRRRVRRHRYDEEDDMAMDEDIMNEELSLEALTDVKSNNVTDWVAQPRVAKTIAREFKSFLTEYTDEQGTSVYGTRIRTLGEVNAESLEVSFDHLSEQKATLAYWLANTPTEMLRIFDSVAMEVVLLHYPDYERIHAEIHVRITEVPVQYTLRQLRQSHLNSLVRVSGVVTRRSGVFPQLKYVKFDCTKCGVTLGPFQDLFLPELSVSGAVHCEF